MALGVVYCSIFRVYEAYKCANYWVFGGSVPAGAGVFCGVLPDV